MTSEPRHFTPSKRLDPARTDVRESFTEWTVHKAHDALVESGLTEQQARAGVMAMYKAGILFRELVEISPPAKPTCRSLRQGVNEHKSKDNPNGTEAQCERRDIHEAHEYQLNFGDYFNVFCPGNDGKKRNDD